MNYNVDNSGVFNEFLFVYYLCKSRYVVMAKDITTSHGRIMLLLVQSVLVNPAMRI